MIEFVCQSDRDEGRERTRAVTRACKFVQEAVRSMCWVLHRTAADDGDDIDD